VKLTHWLENNEGTIADRWMQELRVGDGRKEGGIGEFFEKVVRYLVSFLPGCVGERRERDLEVWTQAAHLYGSLALRRGLAAGEVVEELELLRGVILRLYLRDVPAGNPGEQLTKPEPHRDFLTLNRVLDRGVSRANVSYVDDLFFAHLQGPGVPEEVTDEVKEELLRQLESFRQELGS